MAYQHEAMGAIVTSIPKQVTQAFVPVAIICTKFIFISEMGGVCSCTLHTLDSSSLPAGWWCVQCAQPASTAIPRPPEPSSTRVQAGSHGAFTEIWGYKSRLKTSTRFSSVILRRLLCIKCTRVRTI
jgi:hypothetical protein